MLEFLIVIVAFLGLIIGLFINKYVREELISGRKYFIWAKKILILVLMFIFLYNSYNKYLAILAGLIIGYFFRKEYFYLGMGLAGGFYFMKEVISSLIFLFGLVYTGINHKNWNKTKIAEKFVFFIVPFFILLISFNLFTTTDALAFAGAALIWELI